MSFWKRTVALLSILPISGGWFFFGNPAGRASSAGAAVPQAEETAFEELAFPPTPMCVGDTAPYAVAVRSIVPGESGTVTAAASNGKLGKTQWTFGAPGGLLLGTVATEFTAAVEGRASITLVVEEINARVSASFDIIECSYEINFTAVDTIVKENVTYFLTIEGKGVLDAGAENLAGKGTLAVLVHARTPAMPEGLTCTTLIPSYGKSGFSATGSRGKGGLILSVQVPPVELVGGEYACEDANGRKSNPPLLFAGLVEIQSALPLKDVGVVPFEIYTFSFGPTGHGHLLVTPRKKAGS